MSLENLWWAETLEELRIESFSSFGEVLLVLTKMWGPRVSSVQIGADFCASNYADRFGTGYYKQNIQKDSPALGSDTRKSLFKLTIGESTEKT